MEVGSEVGRGTFSTVVLKDSETVQKIYQKYEDDYSYNFYALKELIILSQFGTPNMVKMKALEITKFSYLLDLENAGTNLLNIVMEMEKTPGIVNGRVVFELPEIVDADAENSEEENSDDAESEAEDAEVESENSNSASEHEKHINHNVEIDNYEYNKLLTDTYKQRMLDLPKFLAKIIPPIMYLHANGVVHNDIKPDNILLHPNNVDIRLIDFTNSLLTKYKSSKCNNSFRAPETFFKREITIASDIWSLGMSCLYFVLHMLLCDRIAPDKVEDDDIEAYLHYQQSKTEYLHFDEDKFSSNPHLLDLIKRMLIFDPKKRITIYELFNDPMFYDHRVLQKIKVVTFDQSLSLSDNPLRTKMIKSIFQYCKITKVSDSFVLAVWILDLFSSYRKLNPNAEAKESLKICISCIIIAASINDTWVRSEKYYELFDKIQVHAAFELDIVMTDILYTCIGRMYIKTFDRMISGKPNYNKIKSILIKGRGKTQEQLLEEYL